MINVTAANIISTGGALNAAIVNSSGGGGGNIVGTANINFNLTGNLQTVGLCERSILNGGATIGGDSSIGSADNHFTLTGDLTASGDANFLIDNSSGGMIGGNTAIKR